MGQLSGVNGSCVWLITFLLPDIVDGAVACVGVFVDLTVADALETARAGQPGPEAADSREHIKVTYQMVSSSFTVQVLSRFLLFRMLFAFGSSLTLALEQRSFFAAEKREAAVPQAQADSVLPSGNVDQLKFRAPAVFEIGRAHV